MEKLLYSDRTEKEQNFIREVCRYVISTPVLPNKEKSNDFAAIFVEGRNRKIDTLEDFAALYSFNAFSQKQYPIFCFVNNEENFLNKDISPPMYRRFFSNVNIIKIPEINSLEEYTKFCIEKLYYLLPPEIENVLTLQPDGMLLKEGWEDYVINSGCDWLSPHWKHYAQCQEYYDYKDYGFWAINTDNIPTAIGNGGFSFRKVSKIKQISKNFKDKPLREYGRDDGRPPMEDLFFTYMGSNYPPSLKMPTLKQCDEFAVDPLTLDIWKDKSKWPFGFHYFKTESEFPPCNHG